MRSTAGLRLTTATIAALHARARRLLGGQRESARLGRTERGGLG